MDDALVDRWNFLYKQRLPELAKARASAQKKWPVYLDHCFARIILDNAIGKDQPWTEVVKQPAVKNMSDEQFRHAIELAEKIVAGEADLDELNEESLRLRGKKRGADSQTSPPVKRVKHENDTISKYFSSSSTTTSTKTANSKVKDRPSKSPNKLETAPEDDDESVSESESVDMRPQLKRIANSSLTAFRKQALSLLCQIPPGRYSTYQAMSDFISKSSHKTCARAVGSAMRNNPFAPEVPCHRVLASDRTIGGFCGSWGEEGKFATQKHELLYKEGVRFDSTGKVKGPVFRDFRNEGLSVVPSKS